jgi:hypothetical protein
VRSESKWILRIAPRGGVAMNSRRLADRLRRLEGRLAPTSHLGPFLIQYVEASGEVTSAVTIEDGRGEWWYAPGHEPLDANGRGGIAGLQQAQMSSDVLR